MQFSETHLEMGKIGKCWVGCAVVVLKIVGGFRKNDFQKCSLILISIDFSNSNVQIVFHLTIWAKKPTNKEEFLSCLKIITRSLDAFGKLQSKKEISFCNLFICNRSVCLYLFSCIFLAVHVLAIDFECVNALG